MPKPTISAIGLWLAAVVGLAAQQPQAARDSASFSDLNLSFQAMVFDFSQMNAALQKINFPTFESGMPGFSVGKRTRLGKAKRWLNEITLDHARASTSWFNPSRSDGRDVTFHDWALTNRIYYDLFPKSRLTKLYPMSSISIRHQRLRMYDGLPTNNSTGQAISGGDLRRIQLTSLPVSMELGLSLEQGIISSGTTQISFTLRGGLLLLASSGWRLDGDFSMDLPEPGILNGFVAFGMCFRENTQPAARR